MNKSKRSSRILWRLGLGCGLLGLAACLGFALQSWQLAPLHAVESELKMEPGARARIKFKTLIQSPVEIELHIAKTGGKDDPLCNYLFDETDPSRRLSYHIKLRNSKGELVRDSVESADWGGYGCLVPLHYMNAPPRGFHTVEIEILDLSPALLGRSTILVADNPSHRMKDAGVLAVMAILAAGLMLGLGGLLWLIDWILQKRALRGRSN